MIISKYFWDLNKGALKRAGQILKNHKHPEFVAKAVTLLSRCDKPKELFSIITKKEFIEIWPKIRTYWMKRARQSTFRDWWETIYEQMLGKQQTRQRNIKGRQPEFFGKFGRLIKEARINKGLSQKQLASIIGMKQPDISNIEDGKKNITLYTLMRLCKILRIKNIDVD